MKTPITINEDGVLSTREIEYEEVASFPLRETFINIPCGTDTHGNPYIRRMKVPHLSITQRIGLWLLGWKVTTST